MPRHTRVAIDVLFTAGMALAAAACSGGVYDRTTDRYKVEFSLSPPVQTGEEAVTVKIVPRAGQRLRGPQVRLHYYPFVDRVKDSLASPEEIVRATPATLDANGYRAVLNLDRPGPWKIAVWIGEAERADEIVYFTVDAQERPASAGK